MTDDRRPKKRFAGDVERVSIGKLSRNTPPRGYPIEIDPEITPPPQTIPIAGDVHDQLRLLADGLGDVTVAIGKLWDERGNSERLTRVETAITGYTAQLARQQEALDGFVVPSCKALMAAADSAGRAQIRTDAQLERTQELLENIAATLKDVVTRIGRLEHTVERLHANDNSLEVRLEATAKMQNAMDVRLTAIERRLSDQALVQTAAETERKKLFTWARAGLVGAGGAIAFAIEKLGLFG